MVEIRDHSSSETESLTWEKESIASAERLDRRSCLASSSRKITVSAILVAADLRGCAVLLAIPKGMFEIEKWDANIVVVSAD